MSKMGRNVFFSCQNFKAMITGMLAILLHWPLPTFLKRARGNVFLKKASQPKEESLVTTYQTLLII